MLGTITFVDEFDRSATTKIGFVSDIAALEGLSVVLHSFSDAVPRIVSVSEDRDVGATPPSNGAYESVEQKAFMAFENVDENNPLKRTLKMNLPAPLQTCFENTEVGIRVTRATGEEIASALGAARGQTVVFTAGHLRGVNNVNQV